MEFSTDLFFKVDDTSLSLVLYRIVVFVLLSAAIIWLLWAFLSKKMYQKNDKLPKEYKLKLTFIWSLTGYFVIFSVYLFFFFKRNGIDSFHWSDPKFYLGIAAHLICIVAAIVLYLIIQFQLANSLKK